MTDLPTQIGKKQYIYMKDNIFTATMKFIGKDNIFTTIFVSYKIIIT